jgi:Bax protein
MLFFLALPGCDPAGTNTAVSSVESEKPASSEISVNPSILPVTVGSMKELGQYYDSIGFNISDNPDILSAVPRLRFTHVPKNWEEEPSIPLKQSVFFRTMTTMALEVNEEILQQRRKLRNLDMNKPLSAEDRAWLRKMMATYRVSRRKGPYSAAKLAELHLRVDIIPPSLTLVQAAIESAWGSSRFAQEGNALFGQWTSPGQGIKAQKSDAWLATFANPHDSVAAYCLNLNTHPSYSVFRVARAKMRREGRSLKGIELAMHLEKYSAKGVEYTSLVQKMITQHGLEVADAAQLADGPEILIKPIERPAPDSPFSPNEMGPRPQEQA